MNCGVEDVGVVSIPKGSYVKDISGKRFGILTVVGFAGHVGGSGKSYWRCECDCGSFICIRSDTIKNNRLGCGCIPSKVGLKHGLEHTSEYNSYCGAKYRCRYKNNKGYSNYGGRGIKFMFESFEEFIEGMGFKPSPTHSLDRIDNDGNYSLDNCRWATRKEQANNRRNTKRFLVNGTYSTIGELTELHDMEYDDVYDKVYRGWDIYKALNITPPKNES